jgi:hypothetical protein
MFNNLTATDHACITPRRIDSASTLPGSTVERHLTAGRGRHFMGRSTGVGHGRGRRRAAAGPSCRRRCSRRRHRCRGGGAGHRARPGVEAAGGVLGCATGVGVGSGRAHTWGPDSRAVVRSGATHGGLTARLGGRPCGGEVGRTAGGEVLARCGRACGWVCGHKALSE